MILTLVLMCATAMAADERKSGLFTYTLKGNGTIIGESAFANNEFSTVIFPKSLLEIEDRAFSNCKNLKSISLPTSVTNIGIDAFDKEIITLEVEQGSYAALWAQENGYSYKLKGNDDLDWLHN